MQQAGTRSRAFTPGRYSTIESGVHAFDVMCADRYAADGVTNRFERVGKSVGTGQKAGKAAR